MPPEEYEYAAGKPNPFLAHLQDFAVKDRQPPEPKDLLLRTVHRMDRRHGGPTQRFIYSPEIVAAFEPGREMNGSRRKAIKKAYRWLYEDNRLGQAYTTYVNPGRYARLNKLVVSEACKRSSDKPLRFCDVGCGMHADAADTLHTKELFRILGADVDVHGVDVIAPELFKELQRSALRTGVKLFVSDYRRHRLPVKYDFIRLGNVGQYLYPEALQRVFDNLAASLNPDGLLMVHQHDAFGERFGAYRRVERDGKVFFRREQIPV